MFLAGIYTKYASHKMDVRRGEHDILILLGCVTAVRNIS